MVNTYFAFGAEHRHQVLGWVLDKGCIAAIRTQTCEQAIGAAAAMFGCDGWVMSFEDIAAVDMSRYPRGVIWIPVEAPSEALP